MTAIPAISRLRRASDDAILAERLEPPYTPLRWQDAPLEPTAIYAEIIDTDGGVWRSPEYTTERRYPLDIYGANIAAAYSLRRLLTSYTGPAIRVRRSSDNVETDIGFTADGDLDTAALLAFVGSANGRVARWYDQSPAARHAVQATATRQPYVVTGGVPETLDTPAGRPALRWDATWLALPPLTLGDFTVVHVAHQPGPSAALHFLVGGDVQGTWVNGTSSSHSGQWGVVAADMRRYGTDAPTSPAVLTASNDRLWHDGVQPVYSEQDTVPGLTVTHIGTRADTPSALSYAGHVSELLLFAGHTPHRSAIEANALHYYGIAT